MKKLLLATITCISLVGCADLVSKINTTAIKAGPALTTACNTAMELAPLADPIAPWIIGGCSTAEAIDKLAADPNSLNWVNDLIAKAKAL